MILKMIENSITKLNYFDRATELEHKLNFLRHNHTTLPRQIF